MAQIDYNVNPMSIPDIYGLTMRISVWVSALFHFLEAPKQKRILVDPTKFDKVTSQTWRCNLGRAKPEPTWPDVTKSELGSASAGSGQANTYYAKLYYIWCI